MNTPPANNHTATKLDGNKSSQQRRAIDVLPLDLIIHIGFTGHRDLEKANGSNREALHGDALERALAGQLDGVFDDVKRIMTAKHGTAKDWGAIYSGNPPVVKFISNLAEESDRIAVKCAKKARLSLIHCLPFNRDTYENDFAEADSKEEYRKLLADGESVFEINLGTARSSRAYACAGRVMLDHSDILIAVWNGEEPEFIGGTAHIVEQARQANTPIIWIHSSGVRPVRFIHEKEVAYSADCLAREITKRVSCSIKDKDAPIAAAVSGYHAEREDRGSFLAHGYRLLLGVLSFGVTRDEGDVERDGNVKKPKKVIRERFDKLAEESLYKDVPETSGQRLLDGKQKLICTQFGWPDNLAIMYADKYRTAAALRHALFFFATVTLCVGFYWGFWNGHWDRAGSALKWAAAEDTLMNASGFLFQALFLFCLLLLVWLNSNRKWHRKFMDYRFLAEMIRAERYLFPLGASLYSPKIQEYHGRTHVWTDLQLRALVRNLGLPDGEINRASLIDNLRAISGFLEAQGQGVRGKAGYHKMCFQRYEKAAGRLGNLVQFFFWTGIIFILIRFGIHFAGTDHLFKTLGLSCNEPLRTLFIKLDAWNGPLKKMFNLCALLLPALGASCYALLNQLGFEKLRDRSEAMVEMLTSANTALLGLIEEIETGNGKDVPFDRVREVALRCCRTFLEEVADWRVFVSSKTISKI